MPFPLRLATLLVLPALCWSRPAHAQPSAERMVLRGHVSSREGRPLSGVVVIVRRRHKMGQAAFWGGAALSDARGDFALEDAEEGDYELGGDSSGLIGAKGVFMAYRLTRLAPPAQVMLRAPIQLSLQVLAPEGQSLDGQALRIVCRQKSELDGATYWRYLTLDAPPRTISIEIGPDSDLFVTCLPLGWAFVDCHAMTPGSSLSLSIPLQKGGSLRLLAQDEAKGQPIRGAKAMLGAPGYQDFTAAHVVAEYMEGNPLRIADIANVFTWEAHERGLVTGEDGALTLPSLRPGYYMVSLEREGFEKPARQLVRIDEGQTIACTFTLKPAAPATATGEPK